MHGTFMAYEQINITTQWSKGQNNITIRAKQQKIRAVKKQGFRNQFQIVSQCVWQLCKSLSELWCRRSRRFQGSFAKSSMKGN